MMTADAWNQVLSLGVNRHVTLVSDSCKERGDEI